MADRILAVNAYTTFTLLDGELEGHGWQTDASAVLNVTTGASDTDGRDGDGESDADGSDDGGDSDADGRDGDGESDANGSDDGDGESDANGSDDGDGGSNDADADDAVVVELELDNTATDDVPPHADRLTLSPAEARDLAAALESSADEVGD